MHYREPPKWFTDIGIGEQLVNYWQSMMIEIQSEHPHLTIDEISTQIGAALTRGLDKLEQEELKKEK